MHILLTNDDGYLAPGLLAMREELQRRGHRVTTVAPFEQQSASSHSITIHTPVRVDEIAPDIFAVHGTPADCSSLAHEALVKDPVDLVVSGINGGQNMGQDVLYSGTVAAAIEAMLLGWRAIAVSAFTFKDQAYDSAAWHTAELIDHGLADLIEPDEILNLNCPKLPKEEVKGYRITRPGDRHFVDFVREEKTEDGARVFKVGGNMPIWDDQPGTDYHEVSQGYISISAIYPAFHKSAADDRLNQWMSRQELVDEV